MLMAAEQPRASRLPFRFSGAIGSVELLGEVATRDYGGADPAAPTGLLIEGYLVEPAGECKPMRAVLAEIANIATLVFAVSSSRAGVGRFPSILWHFHSQHFAGLTV